MFHLLFHRFSSVGGQINAHFVGQGDGSLDEQVSQHDTKSIPYTVDILNNSGQTDGRRDERRHVVTSKKVS